MRKMFWLSLPAILTLASCSMDTLFNIGVQLPTPYSHYAKKRFQNVTAPFDVLIVPGFPYEPNNVSSILSLRIRWACYLFDTRMTDNIIFSGSSVYTLYTEGIVMKLIADSLGIPSDRTFAETKAEHSIENIFYSMKMAREMGFKRIGVATDPFQARMLEPLMSTYCPGVIVVPIVYSKLRHQRQEIPAINPMSAAVENFVSLKERQSRKQRHNGTRGQRVAQEIALEYSREFLKQSDSLAMVLGNQ